ncbi:MAG: nucleotidyl transferase AbiEii/AbiGii toxin family protein [Thermoleophilia bacterium]|nr:nucleotidyl transferase AbiEii/AbiGii toxin family protein [Thermoleophilia bacterium]
MIETLPPLRERLRKAARAMGAPDLDFTALGGPRGRQLEKTVDAVARDAEQMLSDYGPFAVTATRRPERSTHPFGQEAFLVQIQFPWHRSPQRGIKIEVTVDEPLALAPETRPILHPYGEALSVGLPVYRLEEIVAEKLRTPLHAQKRVDAGSWPRNCARDYYDLWYLFRLGEEVVDLRTALEILPQKCAVRDVTYGDADDFFSPIIVSEAERQWETSLGDLVRPLLISGGSNKSTEFPTELSGCRLLNDRNRPADESCRARLAARDPGV